MSDMFQSLDAADTLQAITTKKRATAEAIHADLNGRIERLSARDPKFRGCAAGMPRVQAPARKGAPNWTIDGFTELQSGCFTALVKIVDQVRLEYELAD